MSPPPFSSRTRWAAHPNRWAALRAERERAGGRLIDLTESNPTRAGIEYPAQAVLDALGDARSLRYDPCPLGLPAGRQGVAWWYAARGRPISPDRIILTASTSEAYGFLFKLLADPGDDVLIPRPGYPLFEFLAPLESVVPRPYPLDADDGWSIDARMIEAAASDRTRAVVLVNPNNPIGTFLKRTEWTRLQQACARRGWAVISDEVFSEYAYDEDPARVPCAAAEASVLAFSLGGISKSAGLPQLKLGWIAVGGPEADAREAIGRMEIIADAYLSVSTPVQWGAERLLAAGRAVRDRIRERARTNRQLLAGTTCRPLPAEGGWHAVVQVPASRTGEEWALRLLDQDGVLVHPGYFYDFPREAYLVVSLLPPPESFREGVGRIAERVGAEA